MTPYDLLAHFEVLAEAPNGIQRLRELVLELAVRGKLVEQDPTDEPANALLKRIKGEKAQLIKAGRLRSQSPPVPIHQSEEPFALPPLWEWVHLDELFLVVTDGDHQPPPKADAGIPFLVIGNVSKGKIDFSDTRYVTNRYFEALDWIKRPTPGDILFTVTGSYGLSIIVETSQPFCVQRHIAILKSPKNGHVGFLAYALAAPFAYKFATTVATGIAQKTVPLSGLRSMPIPLPPVAEQRRIVARVDELMALLDRLEAKRNEKEAARAAARDSALAALREAHTPDDVEVAWLRVQERFGELFTTPEDIAPLRQTILSLAVRGRLVGQDLHEEPAKELLKGIKSIKAKLIADGKFRNRNEISIEKGSEALEQLPMGWAWTWIDHCCDVVGGIQKTGLRSPKKNAFPYVRVANVQRGRCNLTEIERFELQPGEIDRWRLEPHDLLVVEGNGSADEIGRCALWQGEIKDCVHQNHIIRCRSFVADLAPYILHYLNSPQGIETMKSLAVTTSGLYNLSVGKIRAIAFPMPPLKEQHRILLRVGDLMARVSVLEELIKSSHALLSSFSAAAIHHLDV